MERVVDLDLEITARVVIGGTLLVLTGLVYG